MTDLSEAEEEYLEALFRLGGQKSRVKIGEISEDLEVKEPSAVEMLKKLEEKDLVDYESYEGVQMTEEGSKLGVQVTRKHRLTERLLCDVLDRDLPQVHEEACELEHSIADETAEEIAKVLEDPETCPHGQPIPKGEGALEDRNDVMGLTEGREGERYRVVSIPEEEEDIQRLLPLAILPGTDLELVDKPSLTAIMVRRGNDKLALSQDLASKIEVTPCGGEGHRHRRRTGR